MLVHSGHAFLGSYSITGTGSRCLSTHLGQGQTSSLTLELQSGQSQVRQLIIFTYISIALGIDIKEFSSFQFCLNCILSQARGTKPSNHIIQFPFFLSPQLPDEEWRIEPAFNIYLIVGYNTMEGAFLGQLTDPQQLQKYTKQHIHHGVNSLSVFNNFKAYIHLSSDPYNIFRYMQEKAICIFLPEFWILKAEYLAQCGDYNGCFECIEEAHSRNGICEEQSERIIDVNKKQAEIMAGLISQMKGFPIKSKRSAEEYTILNSNGDTGRNHKKHQKILSIYQEKYGGLRREKERMSKARRQNKIESWLAEVYEMEEIQQKKIEEKIHENSVRLSREIKYHSMHTPLKGRDPQRLTKTMDSVEILRRKRSTNEKSKRRNHADSDSDDEMDRFDKSRTMMVSSVPVGKSFSNLKRRVTFEMFRELKEKSGIDVEHHTKSEISEESNKPVQKEESRMIDQGSNEFKSLPNPPTKE